MTTLFISDLHLESERPDIAKQLLAFLKEDASRADELYILGDLFEAWVGDDEVSDTSEASAGGEPESSPESP